MNIAVLIPSHHQVSEALLTWTLDGYARQELGGGHTLEVAVGIDGGLDAGMRPRVWRGAKEYLYPRMGAAAVRNQLAAQVGARADLLIFGNADARPAPDMVRRHVEAFAGLMNGGGGGRGCMVLGSAPWEKPLPPGRPTVFDALLAETPMVFFYDRLKAGEWYDFRQCWTLNLSVRAEDFRACGGFHEELRPVYYEDLAFGYKLLGGARKGILYEPRAQVTHRHPTTLAQYLDREELLGLMAPVLGRVCPEAFAAVFGTTDVAGLAATYRLWVEMDGPMHRWIYARMTEWAGADEEVLPERVEDRRRVLETIYQMHVPLKRLAFRLGFVRGVGLAEDGRWTERVVRGEWRRVAEG
jgi:hypothetical protein